MKRSGYVRLRRLELSDEDLTEMRRPVTMSAPGASAAAAPRARRRPGLRRTIRCRHDPGGAIVLAIGVAIGSACQPVEFEREAA
jgi:hypothetical protein